jgi:hypothetical protein
MYKTLFAAIAGLSIGAGVVALAEPVRDTKDLELVHTHVQEAIKEMERAAAANHYDMDGHAKKAEAALHDAEHELYFAIGAARAPH